MLFLLQFKTNCWVSLSVFSLEAPFAASANAVIVTPAPLKADVVPSTGMVITPNLGGVCFQLKTVFFHAAVDLKYEQVKKSVVSFFYFLQASGFHVVPHTQKTPKPIVPKEKSYPSSRKNQKASAGDGESSLWSERP